MSSATKKERVAVAAEELIKAASLHTEDTQIKILRGCLDSLKDTVGTKIEALSPGIDAAGRDVSASIDGLNASLQTVIAKIDASQKMQSIHWAISFIGRPHHGVTIPHVSNGKNLVLTTLISFLKGEGRVLPYPDRCHYDNTDEAKEKMRKEMHESLITLIHDNIGTKPRIEIEQYEYVIYYQ